MGTAANGQKGSFMTPRLPTWRQAVDWALATDVLPSEEDYARDMGVWHISFTLRQVLATPIGGIVLDSFEAVRREGHSHASSASPESSGAKPAGAPAARRPRSPMRRRRRAGPRIP